MSSNRREFLAKSTTSLAAAAFSGTLLSQMIPAAALAADKAKKGEGKTEASAAFAKAVAHCLETGELCLAHCTKELADGNTEMAKCNASVQAMMVVCQSAVRLVALGSAQAKKAVELCAAVCKECAEACEEHKAHFAHGMHLACKSCGEACREMEKACKAYLA
jgi:Cys-rich four helix bundle protein (predicted Tat secretion target)